MNPTKALIITKYGNIEVAIENLECATEVRGWKIVGLKSTSTTFASEIRGQPMFDKLAGPMYGGPGIVRYECWETYDTLSR